MSMPLAASVARASRSWPSARSAGIASRSAAVSANSAGVSTRHSCISTMACDRSGWNPTSTWPLRRATLRTARRRLLGGTSTISPTSASTPCFARARTTSSRLAARYSPTRISWSVQPPQMPKWRQRAVTLSLPRSEIRGCRRRLRWGFPCGLRRPSRPGRRASRSDPSPRRRVPRRP